jgi:tetratricopeptide (TPR) repeat protein
MLLKLLAKLIAPKGKSVKELGGLSLRSDAAERLFVSARNALLGGNMQQAKLLLTQTLQVLPTHGDAWFHMCVVHRSEDNLLDSGICCARALEIDQTPQNWRESLKNITRDIGHPDDLKKWETLAKSHWIAQLALGNTLRRLARLEEAELAYRKAMVQSGKSVFVARRLACLLAVTGRTEEADQHFLACASLGLTPDLVLRMSRDFFNSVLQSSSAIQAKHLPLIGELASTTSELVFLLSCDPGYFRKFAYAAVNSIRQNCKVEFLVHFHIIDPDEAIADEIEQLRIALNLRQLNHSYENAPPGEPWFKRTWYACARYLRLPELLRAYQKPIWLLDLDQLVVGDIQTCTSPAPGAKEADIAVLIGLPSWQEPWEYLWASAVYAAPTPNAMDFVDRAAAYVGHYLDQGQPVWFLDQIALFAAFSQAKPDCVIRSLPAGAAFLANPDVPAEPPSGTVFWSVINSLERNAACLTHPVFLRYAQKLAPVQN